MTDRDELVARRPDGVDVAQGEPEISAVPIVHGPEAVDREVAARYTAAYIREQMATHKNLVKTFEDIVRADPDGGDPWTRLHVESHRRIGVMLAGWLAEVEGVEAGARAERIDGYDHPADAIAAGADSLTLGKLVEHLANLRYGGAGDSLPVMVLCRHGKDCHAARAVKVSQFHGHPWIDARADEL